MNKHYKVLFHLVFLFVVVCVGFIGLIAKEFHAHVSIDTKTNGLEASVLYINLLLFIYRYTHINV